MGLIPAIVTKMSSVTVTAEQRGRTLGLSYNNITHYIERTVHHIDTAVREDNSRGNIYIHISIYLYLFIYLYIESRTQEHVVR